MGTSFTKSQHNQHELAVFGYIRQYAVKCYAAIPLEIQQLCSDFYYQDWYMFLTIGSMGCTRMDFNSMQCVNIKTGQTFHFALKNLDSNDNEPEDILRHEHWDKMFFGQCVQQNVTLPLWILNNYKDRDIKDIDSRHRYNIFYRVAGAYGKNLKLSDAVSCVIYNANELRQSGKNKTIIQGYHCNLPSLQQPLTSVTSVMDNYRNRIYTIGRSEYGKNRVYELDLNAPDLAWYGHEDVLTQKVFGVALSMVHGTNFNDGDEAVMLMCGGRNIARNMVNETKVIKLRSKMVIGMSGMNHARAYFNCVPYKMREQYIVGGGYEECKTLEVLDLAKDKWMLLPQQTNYAHEWGSRLWLDNCNENVVYLCGQRVGYEQYRNLGYIEFCDLRENTNKFSVFQDKSIANVFDIRSGSINDKWESRSLFI